MDIELSRDPEFIWAVAYINSSFISRVQHDLDKFAEYGNIEAYIPTVKILRKQFKGKNEFEYVPLLFNYGFFKIPRKLVNAEFLGSMKDNILCIYAWVKDTTQLIHEKPTLSLNKTQPRISVATATHDEIARLVNTKSQLSVYSQDEISSLQEGMLITLKGYPFDDMPAVVKEINHKSQKVKVDLLLESIMKEVTVAFENVFYTIYHGHYDETTFKEKSLEEIRDKGKNSLDRLFSKSQPDEQ